MTRTKRARGSNGHAEPPADTNGHARSSAAAELEALGLLSPQRPTSPATRIAEHEAPGELRGEGRDIPVRDIRPSPFNPRTKFDDAELDGLAESLRAHGLLQPVVVREVAGQGGYELVAGERRWRAALKAGLLQIPAVIRRLDDQAAREIALLENLQRADLSEIEKARALKQLLEGPAAPTQAELGQRLGLSQSHVSNTVRLLELPQKIQKRIISGEISARAAREIVPYREMPTVLSRIEKDIEDALEWDGLPPADKFRAFVEDAALMVTEPMEGKQWSSKTYKQISIFTPTDAEREKLGLVKIAGEERATNVKLWEQLQERHAAAIAARGEKSQKKPSAKPDEAKPLTAAERKRLEEEEKRRRAELAKQYRRRLWEWYAAWNRWLVARWIREEASEPELLALALGAAASWGGSGPSWSPGECLREALRSSKLPAAGARTKIEQIWQAQDDLTTLARAYLAGYFVDAKGEPIQKLWPDEVVRVAKLAGIDPEAAWLEEQAGPLSEAYWVLHNKEQLEELARELKIELKGQRKADQVAELLARKPKPEDKEVGMAYPKELKRIKRP